MILELKRVIEIIKSRVFKKTSFTILLIAVVIATYLAINLGIQAIDISDIDFTKEKFFSLSEESKNRLKNVRKWLYTYTLKKYSIIV